MSEPNAGQGYVVPEINSEPVSESNIEEQGDDVGEAEEQGDDVGEAGVVVMVPEESETDTLGSFEEVFPESNEDVDAADNAVVATDTADGGIPPETNEGDVSELSEDVIEPKNGMRFESLADLMDFYAVYGRSKGFQIKIKGVEVKSRRLVPPPPDPRSQWDEHANRCRLHCSKAGIFKSRKKNPNNNTRSMKTNCPARVNGWKEEDGSWHISKVVLDHNHDLQPETVIFMARYREISTRDRGRLIINQRAGIPMNKSFLSLVWEHNGFGNTPMLEKDCRNLMDRQRREQLIHGDFAATRKYLDEQVLKCKDYVYVHDYTEDGVLKNLFWIDGRSRSAYKDFGDVVSFDVTYLKNRYRMPFAPFVGVNHHGQSTLMGCALISGEDSDNFVWLFETWKAAMGGRSPKGIITDQDKAIAKAIAKVFPKTTHRLCMWHIMQNAKKHLGFHEKWEEIETRITGVLHNSINVLEFEHSWKCLVLEFELGGSEWLRETYEIRDRWVPVYFKDTFWAGMSTTQRSEGMNNFFKSFVNLNSTLIEFVQQFNVALSKRVQDESRETFSSRNCPLQLSSTLVYERIFQGSYTSAKFAEVQEQVGGMLYLDAKKVRSDDTTNTYIVTDKTTKCLWYRPEGVKVEVKLDKSRSDLKCECKHFEYRGILCRHIMKVMHKEGFKYVPEKYILDRWRKDLSRNYLSFNIPEFGPGEKSAEERNYDTMIQKFDSIAQMLAGSHDMVQEFMTNMEEIRKKAEADAVATARLDVEDLPGVGRVFKRRKRRVVSQEDSNNVGEEHVPETPANDATDPPDLRGRGPTPKNRKGYKKTNRGRRSATADAPPTPSTPQAEMPQIYLDPRRGLCLGQPQNASMNPSICIRMPQQTNQQGSSSMNQMHLSAPSFGRRSHNNQQ